MIIGIIIYFLVCLLIYVPAVKKIKNKKITARNYILCIVESIFLCTLVIMILELSWDRFIFKEAENFLQGVIISFFRAALIEESVKFFFVRKFIKKYQPASKAEYMLLAATVGIGYGFSEKMAIGGGIILIVNSIIPLHMFFQMMMGEQQYKYIEEGNKKAGWLSFLKPFFFHGLWDSVLTSLDFLMADGAPEVFNYIGLLILIVAVVFALVYEVKTVKRLNREIVEE